MPSTGCTEGGKFEIGDEIWIIFNLTAKHFLLNFSRKNVQMMKNHGAPHEQVKTPLNSSIFFFLEKYFQQNKNGRY